MSKGMFGNFFLLTHKCGNMFMEEVFRDEEISDSFFNLTRTNIDRDDLSHLHIEKLMNWDGHQLGLLKILVVWGHLLYLH